MPVIDKMKSVEVDINKEKSMGPRPKPLKRVD